VRTGGCRVAGLPEGDAAAGGRLLHDLLGQRDAARERLLQGMEERRYTALLDDLVAAAQAPAVLPEAAGLASEASPPLVAKAWRRLRKAVRRAGATPSDEALHQIRIRAKRARAVVAEAWLRENAGFSRGTTTLAAGQLIAAERTSAQAAREHWRPAWKTVAGKKRTGWL
jgi:CHAD domain-containing protein